MVIVRACGRNFVRRLPAIHSVSCRDAARKPKFVVALEDYEIEPKWLRNITREHVV